MKNTRLFVVGFLAILIFTSVACSGQRITRKKLISKFEVAGGPALLMNTGYLNDFKPTAGYSLGFGAYASITKSFDINVRGMWETKGSLAYYNYGMVNYKGVAPNGNIVEMRESIKTNFRYFTLSMLPTFSIGKNKNFSISAGGYYSFLRGVNTSTTVTDRSTNEVLDHRVNYSPDQFNKNYDFGASVAVGYSFNVNEKNKLLIQAVNNHGLVDIHNGWMGSQRNNALILMISLQFSR